MRPSRSLGTELWREIVERLDEGVIVFNQRGVAIYANDESARLLDYKPRDVLELEKDDFVALCDQDRLDGARFAGVFLADPMPPEGSGRHYELVTTRRRLMATPLALSLEHGTVTLLMLRELSAWRSDLIARTVASDMHGPLSVIAHYSEMLIQRLQDDSAHPFEIRDLARIIHDSLGKAMSVWEMLSQLHSVDPREATTSLAFESVDVSGILRSAVAQVEQEAAHATQLMRLEIDGDLAAVRASPQILHSALSILIAQAIHALPPMGSLTISARNYERYVRIDLKAEPEGAALRTHLFDVFPLSNVEQTILRHGGRVWTDKRSKRVSFSLPIWTQPPPA
jgi:signal transduction histidine kinase